ncbi:MAG: GNAT family N-acetyltransferase [Spirochaetaceae bacterium]|nr:MAG: GNAT family N-acetyltransferase [Spirochaetaceae bacterium]
MMEAIRPPVDPAQIDRELGPGSLVRSFRGIAIHVIDGRNVPAVMEEIGRIRETEFRAEGGGTGKPVDVDDYDIGDRPFRQLVAWDTQSSEIVGMYRFVAAAEARSHDAYELPTARLFDFSPAFKDDVLPHTIELGRSVVNRSAKRAVMGLFAAWSGLGAIVAEFPEYRHFFGKFTTYPSFDPKALALLLGFLDIYCGDPDAMVVPKPELAVTTDPGARDVFCGSDYASDYELLAEKLKELGQMIPPLVISYLGLTSTMKCYGTARNPYFGNVLETAILINIADIGQKQWKRFVTSYESKNPAALR